ncbi:hypothetical protein [Sulfolobus spindle-shaped virus 6]|uniref:Uncharacterized protein n=1 Tax=Sulfolobus spindle-shaped virus 6 TaxID=693627 RepID=D1GF30_9VIRU|nr:hypothetical protein SSSV6_gp12 [Sulfolobus spindle-shaped virus 6]ACZ35732.1 hypothetical protein [Sulfolobus spindle-shaped virus 6]
MERVMQEILLTLLENKLMKDKDLITDLLKKGFSKYDIINGLIDLHLYGYVKMHDSNRKGVYIYELTQKGRMEAEALEDSVKKSKNEVTRL